MDPYVSPSDRKKGSVRYYSDLLGFSIRKVNAILVTPGGREELDAMVKDLCPSLVEEIDEANRAGLTQKKLIALNEDSLMHCAISFNKWAKTDKTKNKYAYNETAKTDMMFMKMWADLVANHKKKK